jgi:hypothetical protein
MDDTSLTLEGGQAKHCQAQLTRLQRALGLKGELDSNAQLLYGQEVPAIEPDKSTNFDRKGDVILVSLDLVVKKKDGMLTDVCWAIRTLIQRLSKKYLQRTTCGHCRSHVLSMAFGAR